MSNEPRILFISANRIGDAVLSMGVLDYLVTHYPTARFTIACGPVARDLFRAVPRLENLIVMKKKPHHGHWVDLWKTCRTTQWDLIVDLRNSIVSRLLPAKKRGYRPAHITGAHRVENNAAALKLSPPPCPRMWLDDKARQEAAKLIGESDTPILAIGAAANWGAKQWPIYNFVCLARRLLGEGAPFADARLMILAAPSERQMIADLFDVLPKERIIDGIGLDLLAAAACLEHAKLFVGNDSGLMHIAAATGIPTTGLFGPSREEVYGPWGKKTQALRGDLDFDTIIKRMAYSGAEHPNMMTSLSVDKVFNAVVASL